MAVREKNTCSDPPSVAAPVAAKCPQVAGSAGGPAISTRVVAVPVVCKLPGTASVLPLPTSSRPELASVPTVVKLRPAAMRKPPWLSASELIQAMVEPAPSSTTAPWFTVTLGAPATASVAPARATQVPPVSVVPENCAAPPERLNVRPDWSDSTAPRLSTATETVPWPLSVWPDSLVSPAPMVLKISALQATDPDPAKVAAESRRMRPAPMPVLGCNSIVPWLVSVPRTASTELFAHRCTVARFSMPSTVVVVLDTLSTTDTPVLLKLPPAIVPPRRPTLPPLAAMTPAAVWVTGHQISSRPPLVASIVPSLVFAAERSEIVLPE